MSGNVCCNCGGNGARAYCPECHARFHARCGRREKGKLVCGRCTVAPRRTSRHEPLWPCVEHEWTEKKITDSNGFGVVFGAERTCDRCGKRQVASYCEGRAGGPWRDVETLPRRKP